MENDMRKLKSVKVIDVMDFVRELVSKAPDENYSKVIEIALNQPQYDMVLVDEER